MDFCKKKKAIEEVHENANIGEQWISASLDPQTKVVVAYHRGRRDEKALTELIEKTAQHLESPLDAFYVSDEWDAYAAALKNIFHEIEHPEPLKGPGRPRKPRLIPHRNLKYAVVHKTRKQGRVTKVERKVIYGDEGTILDMLNKSSVSKTINTSFIERYNMNMRHFNGRLHRKSLCFSKEARLLDCQLILFLAYYHFVLTHGGLDIKRPGDKIIKRTPFMAAGFTDKVWNMEELLKYIPTGSS